MNLLLWNGIHSIVSCIGMEKSNNQDMDLVSTWLNFHSHDPTYSITSILFLFQQKSNGSNWFLLFTCKKNQCSIWIHFTTCIAKVNFSIFLLHSPDARNPVRPWISNTVAISESEPPILLPFFSFGGHLRRSRTSSDKVQSIFLFLARCLFDYFKDQTLIFPFPLYF